MRSSLFWIVVCCGLIAGCAADDPHHDAVASDEPVAGGTAVIALSSDPDGLNPLTRTTSAAGVVLDLVSTGLVEMRPDLTWEPRIATGWEVSPDSLTITYRLRPWRWEDGEPLTAQDLVVSWRWLVDPRVASPRRDLLAAVASVEAPDASTVVYRLAHKVADPVQATSHAILPAHRLATLEVTGLDTWELNRRPVSSGPFRLEEWRSGSQITLARNPKYTFSTVYLDRVILRILPDETARVLALEAGDVDVVADVKVATARRLASRNDIGLHEISGRVFGFLLWNTRRPALADPRVRRALSLAIDRGRIADDLFGGFATPAASYLPPILWNHHPELAPDPFRPDSAGTLLAAAGWQDRDGDGVRERGDERLSLEIIFRGGDPLAESVAAVLRQNLAAVGVAVSLRGLEHATGLDFMRQGRFDAYWGEFQANIHGDPSALIRSGAGGPINFGGYANATVDSLLDEALAISDHSRARPVWYALQEELARDQPAAVVYYLRQIVAVNRRLRDATPHMLSPINELEKWWIAPADRRWLSETGSFE